MNNAAHATRFSHFLVQVLAGATWLKEIEETTARRVITQFFGVDPDANKRAMDSLYKTYEIYLTRGVGSGSYITPESTRYIVNMLHRALPGHDWDHIALPIYLNRLENEAPEDPKADIEQRTRSRWFCRGDLMARATADLREAGMLV